MIFAVLMITAFTVSTAAIDYSVYEYEIFEPDGSSDTKYLYPAADCNRMIIVNCVDQAGTPIKTLVYHTKHGADDIFSVSIYGYDVTDFESDQGLWETCKMTNFSGGYTPYEGSVQMNCYFRTGLSKDSLHVTITMRKAKTITLNVEHYTKDQNGTKTLYSSTSQEINYADEVSIKAISIPGYKKEFSTTIDLVGKFTYTWWDTPNKPKIGITYSVGESPFRHEGGPWSEFHESEDGKLVYCYNRVVTVSFTYILKTYDIQFDANGGSGAPDAMIKTYGIDLTLPTTIPTREGYDFQGWGLSANDTSANYQPGGTYSSNIARTFYAVWDPDTYTVSYNANGGSGAPVSQTKYHDTALTLSSTIPTKGGYDFLGWSTSASATAPSYYAGSFYTGNASVTFYAVWEKSNYEFSIDEPTLSSDTVNKYETIEITVRTDSWDERNAYDLIPLDLYFDGEWIERVYLSFEEFGVVTYTFDFNIGGFAGEHEILIRINEDDYLSETDPTNNEVIASVTVLNNYELSISPIPVEDSYTEGTTVITGFTVFNDSDTDLLPSDGISACFEVYYMDGTTVIYLTEQYWDRVIAPMGNANLIYFKWTVPNGFADKTLICRCTVDPEGFLNGDSAENNTVEFETVIASSITSQTANTRYESQAPSGYGNATFPDAQSNGLSWNQWEYENGTFVLKEYGVRIVLNPIVAPEANCKTAFFKNGIWNMKSGYGITISLIPTLSNYGGFEMPSSDAITTVQAVSVLLPEYMYSTDVGTYRTLELFNGAFCFAENSEADANARVHFLPVYLMDGNYTVCVIAGEFWTPVGKIGATGHANPINVSGTIYDDYYVGN